MIGACSILLAVMSLLLMGGAEAKGFQGRLNGSGRRSQTVSDYWTVIDATRFRRAEDLPELFVSETGLCRGYADFPAGLVAAVEANWDKGLGTINSKVELKELAGGPA